MLCQPAVDSITRKAYIKCIKAFRVKYDVVNCCIKRDYNTVIFLLILVTPTGQFSNQLLERLRKMYELKAVIPVQMLQPAIMPTMLKVA